MYDREDPIFVVKEVTFYGGHDRIIAKYECFFNMKSHGKITSL